MAETKVTFEALSSAHSDINAAWGSITQQMEDLKKFVNNFAQDWTGSAAEAYQGLQQQWDSAANDLAQVLHTIGSAVDSANQNYQAAETANKNIFG
jgi:WXG100 family type VII secretion target